MALPQIQAGLGVAEADVGWLGSILRLGALPAVFIALAADRIGRRRALLFTVLAYTAITGATAFAPDVQTFALLQFLARVFGTAEMLLAIVVISIWSGSRRCCCSHGCAAACPKPRASKPAIAARNAASGIPCADSRARIRVASRPPAGSRSRLRWALPRRTCTA
jgi:hypothetical protein